jgi:broad specificity phosphatase PhoE
MNTSRRSFLISTLAACLAVPSAFMTPGDASGQTTTVIVVRHAERAAEPRQDPVLSPEGVARANALLEAVRDAGIDAIYTTQYARTRLTAEPIARALGLETRVIEATPNTMAPGSAGSHPDQVAARIRQEHAAGTVLVVGHSNTVPAIVAALGGGDVGPIADDVYDNLFIVQLDASGKATLIRTRFGAPSGSGSR